MSPHHDVWSYLNLFHVLSLQKAVEERRLGVSSFPTHSSQQEPVEVDLDWRLSTPDCCWGHHTEDEVTSGGLVSDVTVPLRAETMRRLWITWGTTILQPLASQSGFFFMGQLELESPLLSTPSKVSYVAGCIDRPWWMPNLLKVSPQR